MVDFSHEDNYTKLSFLVSFIAIGLGAVFGLLQVLERVPGLNIISARFYYTSLTGHGVLMAIVFTTFFVMGMALFAVSRSLNINVYSQKLNTLSYALAILGTAMAALVILAGRANVLFTFYPPMKANPLFYIGATILIVGTWVYTGNILLTIKKWRSQGNEGRKLPLMVFGVVTTLIIWILATIGIAIDALFLLIPWSLGIVGRIDPLLSRNFFWFFGHPLVYFWLLPAYIVWYTILPKVLNVRLFSDKLGRVAFVLFILFSVPVGYHHQFMDPGIGTTWKFLHTILTYFVAMPSLMTAFTITATMEMSARKNGGKGLFGWISKLPWNDPTFAAIAFAMIGFGFGGAGGMVNAGYNLNNVIHNTIWVTGHLHLTVGTAVALTFMGLSYFVVPLLVGRELYSRRTAIWQVYLWAIGMVFFSGSLHYIGLLGSPRRTFDATYGGNLVASAWSPFLLLSAVGGALLFVSIALFLGNIMLTVRSGKKMEMAPVAEEYEALGTPDLLDNFKIWVAIAVILIAIAYVTPTLNIIRMGSPGAPPIPVP